MTQGANRNGSGKARCPICGKEAAAEFRPFCSRRCADVDLSRWLRGGYAIPGSRESDEDGEAAAQDRPADREEERGHEDD
jgi:endogenous inhibitor of DNA gyrase (YacG/DUF329 family)